MGATGITCALEPIAAAAILVGSLRAGYRGSGGTSDCRRGANLARFSDSVALQTRVENSMSPKWNEHVRADQTMIAAYHSRRSSSGIRRSLD
jgi:hypothetical protein